MADTKGWAIVTGAAQRLGRVIALELAAAGFDIVLHYRQSGLAADETGREIGATGRNVVMWQADLADLDGLEDSLAQALGGAEPVGLVNCASVFARESLATLSVGGLKDVLAVNALAPLLLSRAVAQAPGEATRSIVNILDFKLAASNADCPSYTLSKHALAGQVTMLARTLAPRVRVNGVAPGYILPSVDDGDTDYAAAAATNPLGHATSPEDVARTVTHLMTAPAITGQIVAVDAGLGQVGLRRDVAAYTPNQLKDQVDRS